jgi:hypothetical protein
MRASGSFPGRRGKEGRVRCDPTAHDVWAFRAFFVIRLPEIEVRKQVKLPRRIDALSAFLKMMS